MNIKNFFELFFVAAAGIAMPFIVIGSYFNLVPYDERQKPIAILFLIISLLYALTYSYFSLKSIQETKSWKMIKGGNSEEKKKNR